MPFYNSTPGECLRYILICTLATNEYFKQNFKLYLNEEI